LVALVGWPPFTYGHLGKASSHPSLQAIVGVGIDSFDKMIDYLFTFHEEGGRHPAMLLVGGELRPLMHVTLATMIMYYHVRFLAEEMHSVLTHMRTAYSATIGAPGEDAHAKLIEWGVAIKTQFDVDNLHLVSKEGSSGNEKVVQAVKQLGSANASMKLQLSDIACRQVRIESKLDQLIGLLSRGASLPVAVTTAADAAATTADAAAAIAAATIATAAATTPVARPAQPSSSADAAAGPRSISQLGRMATPGLTQHSTYSTAKLPVGRYILDCMGIGGNVPFALQNDDRKRSAAQGVLNAYLYMALDSELVIFRDKSQLNSDLAHETINEDSAPSPHLCAHTHTHSTPTNLTLTHCALLCSAHSSHGSFSSALSLRTLSRLRWARRSLPLSRRHPTQSLTLWSTTFAIARS
jgi:hypothetical protein